MHIVIVGAGKIGRALAQWLVSFGHEVALLDKDSSKCASVDEVLGSISIVGDATDSEAQVRAGVGRADVLVSTTERDDVNLVVCQLAKELFNVKNTISVVNLSEHSTLFTRLGVDVIVNLTEMVLANIQQALTSRGLSNLMTIVGAEGKYLVSIKIPVYSRGASRALKDIALPDDTTVSLVISSDGIVSMPDESTLIRAGDDVVAVTTDGEGLRRVLTEGFND